MRAYERFLKYAAYNTTSSETGGTTPSTPGQLVLAQALCDELREMGMSEVRLTEEGYVYAKLPSNTDAVCNAVGFIAHMDTSPEASGENVKCRVVMYEGGDILLNEERGIYLRCEDYPYLSEYSGQHLIVSDGTTLIGADDKAGIAEIMTALDRMRSSEVAHGDIWVAFTPDEEIGAGADHFDLSLFPADYAYTVDGGALGELEYENFNAASAKVTVTGVSIHPGSAKGRMKNAARIISEFDGLLPAEQIPELTEGYEGFHHLLNIEGGCERAEASYIIRDHDMERFEIKKHQFENAAAVINGRYGEGTLSLQLTDSYYNMKSIIEANPFTVQRAKRAMEQVGVAPIVVPIRGGTDGARLSFMGLPCPNLCTGGMNFHSRFEFVSVEAMDKVVDIILRIAENCPDEGYERVKK